MQSTTAEGEPLSEGFADEVLSPEQIPLGRLRVGWGGDTDFSGEYAEVPFTSLSISRQLTGSLPDVVETTEGFSSAALDAELPPLDVEGERKAAWWYSRFNAESPLFNLEPLGAEVTADIGLRTDAGLEYVRKFTGTLRNIKVKSTSATAAMSSLDYREKLRAQVRLPMVVGSAFDATVQPNLSVNWIVNEALRANSVYVVPPLRDQCLWAASFLGSTWPSVGTVTESHIPTGLTAGTKAPPTFNTDGPFGPALDPMDEDSRLFYEFDTSAPSIGPQPGQAFLAEGWIYAGETTGVGVTAFSLFSLTRPGEGGTGNFATIGGLIGGRIRWITTRVTGGAPEILTGPTITGPDAWHYIGIHVAYSDNDILATFNVDGVITADSASTAIDQDWAPDWTAVDLSENQVPRSAWQITAEPEAPDSWGSDFIPTAVVERSTNTILAIMPTDDQDSWALLKDLSSTEFASIFFDEFGIFRWWSTTHWDLPETQTVVREITADNALIDIGYQDGIDQIRNVVRVHATPLTVGDPQYVWSSGEVYEVPAQSAIEIWASFEDPVWQLDTAAWLGPPFPDASHVTAQDAPDGSGNYVFDYTATITAFATAAKIAITNNSTDPIWIVGFERAPGIKLWGRPVTTETGSTVSAVRRAPYSIAKFGEQELNVAASPWRQTMAGADSQADYLSAQLSGPRPLLTDIFAAGDARLLLGDRVRFVDREGTAIVGTYRLVGIDDSLAPAKFIQGYTARLSPTPAVWGESTWGGGDSWA